MNYSKVLKKTIERVAFPCEPLIACPGTRRTLHVIPCRTALAEASAALYPQTKECGLSFAERAGLALRFVGILIPGH